MDAARRSTSAHQAASPVGREVPKHAQSPNAVKTRLWPLQRQGSGPRCTQGLSNEELGLAKLAAKLGQPKRREHAKSAATRRLHRSLCKCSASTCEMNLHCMRVSQTAQKFVATLHCTVLQFTSSLNVAVDRKMCSLCLYQSTCCQMLAHKFIATAST